MYSEFAGRHLVILNHFAIWGKFKVKYDFSTNKGRNNCNTSIFDCKIHFWYIFCDLESSLKTEGQFQG